MSKNAYTALAKAQAEMGKAIKNAKNPHFRAAYADLGAVQEACYPALHSNGFAVFQPTGRDEFGPHVRTIFAHESGETLECRTDLLIDKNNMQGLGSAITYARRYGLLCMSGLAPEDDDGNATAEQTRKPEPAKSPGDYMWALDLATTAEEYAEQRRTIIADFGAQHDSIPQQLAAKMKEVSERVGFQKPEKAA